MLDAEPIFRKLEGGSVNSETAVVVLPVHTTFSPPKSQHYTLGGKAFHPPRMLCCCCCCDASCSGCQERAGTLKENKW